MTRFQALLVKYWRVKCDGSWRWVAGKWDERYIDKLPFTFESTYGGNQISSMNLCAEARKILGEKVENGWN